MNPGLLFYIVTMSIVYLVVAAWCVHAIRNPRTAWDRMYGRHTQGGEPLPGALEKIQRQSAIGLIVIPILFAAGGFLGNLKFQELERKWQRERDAAADLNNFAPEAAQQGRSSEHRQTERAQP
jgi:hypothetical protein